MAGYRIYEAECRHVCESIVEYSRYSRQKLHKYSLFNDDIVHCADDDIRVVELFAGVGGFRIGFERASKKFKTVWNNQWEPSTKRQDASIVYCNRFGVAGHSNEDISLVPATDIPYSDILCAGFPCQDYSVATTLVNSKGIEGKKGILWWQIHRILKEKGDNAPKYLVLENVDRLLSSPVSQRGRDFSIILASLSDLGYIVEWRVINAADYGMPQRRRRTYMVAYRHNSAVAESMEKNSQPEKWILKNGILGSAFICVKDLRKLDMMMFELDGSLQEISATFNTNHKSTKSKSPYRNAGLMIDRTVWTMDVVSSYSGPALTLGDILVPDSEVPDEYFIDKGDLPRWEYLKGCKSEKRVSKEGYEYEYKEGAMTFPDAVGKPSRTIITGEGGSSPSRFKHVIRTENERFRRLVPVELERLNMFPDNHTAGVSDISRAFLMGNALVTGIVERIGIVMENRI